MRARGRTAVRIALFPSASAPAGQSAPVGQGSAGFGEPYRLSDLPVARQIVHSAISTTRELKEETGSHALPPTQYWRMPAGGPVPATTPAAFSLRTRRRDNRAVRRT